jgi:prepilin signal peptidase PulO-like enzyme (type II secretory pathway)
MVYGENILSLAQRLIVGGLVGLIINYLTDVLPAVRRLSSPICRECETPLHLKTYILDQCCPVCGQRRGVRFFIVIVAAAILSVLIGFFPFANLNYWAALPILAFFGVIVVIDIEHRLVLFETTLFGLAIFVFYGIFLNGLFNTLLGALGGFGITLAFFLFGILFTKVIGRLRGQNLNAVAFGFGDVSAGAFLGLLTGWPGIAGAIIVALLSFGAFSLVFLALLIVTKRYQAFSKALPFVPFLVLGVIVMYYL